MSDFGAFRDMLFALPPSVAVWALIIWSFS